jgi:hypothetical protein
MNKFSAKNPTAAKWYLLLAISFFLGLAIWTRGYDALYEEEVAVLVLPTINHANASQNATSGLTESPSGIGGGKIVKVTAFSSHECKTTWCRAHAGEPRGQRVAVNAKFGKVSRVYIPVYEKWYDVIGTTDYKTDVDVWFGDEYANALDFGSKNLLVHFE